ncbi:MAG: SRPBCC family protein [Prolixibacteraceae bacterium]|nr:SRPBCC family protein [Prolixibacteraceae bacterium]
MRKLVQKQVLPISLNDAWEFFATPKNLNEVTPADMTFEFTSELPGKMYEGVFISYRIRPFLNIPMNWITEITHIKEKDFFVDEQRVGPYKIWHHEHHFEAVEKGVLMTDILHYDIGMSFLGWFAGVLFVHRKVKNIFEFRHKELERIFE